MPPTVVVKRKGKGKGKQPAGTPTPAAPNQQDAPQVEDHLGALPNGDRTPNSVLGELMNDPPPDLIRAWLLATYYDRGDTGTRKRQADIWSAGAESERERKIIRVALNMADAQAALTLRNATVVDLTMGTGEAATTTPRPDVFAMQQKVKSLKDATKEAANKSAVEFGFVTLQSQGYRVKKPYGHVLMFESWFTDLVAPKLTDTFNGAAPLSEALATFPGLEKFVRDLFTAHDKAFRAAAKSLLMAVGLGEKGCPVDDNAAVAAAAFTPHDSEDSSGNWDPACVRANTAVLLRLAKLVLQKLFPEKHGSISVDLMDQATLLTYLSATEISVQEFTQLCTEAGAMGITAKTLAKICYEVQKAAADQKLKDRGDTAPVGNPRSAATEALQFLFPLLMLHYAALIELLPTLPRVPSDLKAEFQKIRSSLRTVKRDLGSAGGMIENRTYDLRLSPAAEDTCEEAPPPITSASGNTRRSPRRSPTRAEAGPAASRCGRGGTVLDFDAAAATSEAASPLQLGAPPTEDSDGMEE